MSKKLPKYLPLNEIKALLEAPYPNNTKDRLILRLMANAGLRVSEVINLQRKNFHFEEDLLIVRGGKGNKDRVIPLTHQTLRILAYNYTEDLKPEDKLFDLSRQSIYGMVVRYAKRAQIDHHINPHQLRHTFAVHTLKAGVDLRSLQKMMGHSRLQITTIYLDITVEDISETTRNHPLPY